MSVQRTRASPSALRSALARRALGDGSFGQPVWLCVEPVGTATPGSIAGRNRIELGVDMRWQAPDTGARCIDPEIESSDWRNSHA